MHIKKYCLSVPPQQQGKVEFSILVLLFFMETEILTRQKSIKQIICLNHISMMMLVLISACNTTLNSAGQCSHCRASSPNQSQLNNQSLFRNTM